MMKNMKMSFMIVAVFATVVFSGKVFALSYESEQGISFTLNPVIRITLSSIPAGGSTNLNISDLAPGSTSDSNIIKVTAESNAVAGYTLSSTVGNNTTYNNTNLTHTNGTSTFTNLSSNKETLANFDPSTWGYSYATCTTTECTNTPSWISGDITGTTNSGYNGLPLYTTSNPIKLINATTPGSSAVQFKFGAKADTAQLAGTYNNVINFIGVGKIITTSYTINFNDPSGEATSGTIPASQTGTSTTGSVQISSTQPVRTNYIFKGWCTESTSDDTCSGDTVQPGGMLALHPGTTNLTPTVTRTLYAMWGSNIAKTYMQDMTSTDCTTTATTVYDNRDEEPYLVQRLADGKCWMLDNLRLDPTTVSLSDLKGNTNASDTTLEYLKNGGGTTSDQYPTVAVGYGDSSNYYSVPKVSVGGTCYNAFCVDSPSSGQWNSEVVTPATINGNTSIAQGKIGVYYNYCAASAGSYCWGDGTASTGSPSSDPDTSTIRDVTEDLCPAGWHMPTSDTNGGEYDALYTAYNSDYTAFQTALVTPLSGYFRSGTARNQGNYGSFWSSTWYNTNDMRYLLVYSSYVGPSDYDHRFGGNSLRCSLGS